MPETIRNRILAVALMAALVLVSISPATVLVQAQEVYVHDSRVVESTTTSDCAVTKHETVYVNLAADGAVQQVNVSDHLHTELPQVRIEDASDLSDITDVKTGETPERSNGRLFWQMDGTDLYYSGRSDSTPPMQFDIDYMINGVPIAPDQLAGKSGRLTIHVEAENTLVKPVTVNGVSYDLTCPMLLVGGMLLPEEGFENVEVSNGAVLGDGAHRIVLMMGVPGMEESLGISALGLPLLGEQMGKLRHGKHDDCGGAVFLRGRFHERRPLRGARRREADLLRSGDRDERLFGHAHAGARADALRRHG